MAENKETILIVDSKKTTRKTLRKTLESEGFRCIEAGNTDQALERIEAEPVDFVLLDIKMPGKTETGLLAEIKELYPDVAVIMTTDVSDMDTAIEYVKQDAYDYVTKPFNPDNVVQSVQRAADKKRLELQFRDYQRYIDQRIEEHVKDTRQTLLSAMAALSYALEARDSYTTGHSHRVADIAIAIGQKLGLEQDELEDLRWGSLVHDIGKIAVDRLIINKPDKLSAKEYEHVMTHTTIGASIVESVIKNKRIIEIVEHHHDHYDGKGLKQKLQGKDIPLLARIVSVADAYDAMTSARPYRTAWSNESAIAEMKWEIGKQFDPDIVNAFLEISSVSIVPEKIKILIADDEDNVKQLVRSVLGNDYTVIEVSNGQEAVEAAKSHQPSLVLMDTLMPGKDGLRALYEIKTNLTTKEIPVVMMTTTSQDPNWKYSIDLGADHCISKPFSPQDLLNTVDQFLKVLQ